MEKLSLEVKVGIVVTAAVAIVLAFLFLLGEYNPFSNTYRITVTLNYAGGIKPGADVMVAGAKVGKVDAIRFLGGKPGEAGKLPVLGLELTIDKRAREMIREDSVFSVNIESLLGGKVVEIAPGTTKVKVLEEGAVVRGQDPLRMEELINRGSKLLQELENLLKSLSPEDRELVRKLLQNLGQIDTADIENLRRVLRNSADASEDLKAISAQLRPEVGLILGDLRGALSQTRPLLAEARTLMNKIDRIMSDLRTMMPKDPAATRAKLEELLNTVEALGRVMDRLDRFTGRMEKELEGVTRQDVERWLRQFLQQEGITINVGTIVGNPRYPPPPPPSTPDGGVPSENPDSDLKPVPPEPVNDAMKSGE